LVLNFVDGALGSPVNGITDIGSIKLHNIAFIRNIFLEIVSISLELVLGLG